MCWVTPLSCVCKNTWCLCRRGSGFRCLSQSCANGSFQACCAPSGKGSGDSSELRLHKHTTDDPWLMLWCLCFLWCLLFGLPRVGRSLLSGWSCFWAGLWSSSASELQGSGDQTARSFYLFAPVDDLLVAGESGSPKDLQNILIKVNNTGLCVTCGWDEWTGWGQHRTVSLLGLWISHKSCFSLRVPWLSGHIGGAVMLRMLGVYFQQHTVVYHHFRMRLLFKNIFFIGCVYSTKANFLRWLSALCGWAESLFCSYYSKSWIEGHEGFKINGRKHSYFSYLIKAWFKLIHLVLASYLWGHLALCIGSVCSK